MNDRDLIAKFLAEKGATTVNAGIAYGVNRDADKAKRAEARAQRGYEATEQRAERAAEAFASGDVEAGYAELTGYERVGAGRYRSMRLNRY